MKDYFESKCYEVLSAKELYERSREKFFDACESLKKDDFCISSIDTYARDMQDSYRKYRDIYFQVHQFIWATKNDEHKNIWNSIVGNDEKA